MDAAERLRKMMRSLKFPIMAMSEPYYKGDQLDKYRITLGYNKVFSNINSQIRIFWEDGLDCGVINSDEQQVSSVAKKDESSFIMTLVYAKRSAT